MNKIGIYPSCDHLNNALRDLLSDNPNILSAISEITYAIQKADGYFHADINEKLKHFLDMPQNEGRIYSDMKLIKDAINDPNKNGFDICRLIKSITDEYDFKEEEESKESDVAIKFTKIKTIIDNWAVDDDEHELLEQIADIIDEEVKEAENEVDRNE